MNNEDEELNLDDGVNLPPDELTGEASPEEEEFDELLLPHEEEDGEY